MKIILIEPFYAGSHKLWADGLAKHSQHEFKLFTLEGRHWKWRMHGGAVSLAKSLNDSIQHSPDALPDRILVTSMTDLTVFKSLLHPVFAHTPIIYYFHENQLVYPWSPDDPDILLKRDRHYAFIHVTSALAADEVWFNSEVHRQQFLAAIDPFLTAFPDHQLRETTSEIASKARVMHLGLELEALTQYDSISDSTISALAGTPPTILWNHRWEYDKNPEEFFEALFTLAGRMVDFELVVTGESYTKSPPIFAEAREKLQRQIVHFGYCESREEYAQWLHRCDFLPVTSRQDFFGISVVEAMACGVTPLLPDDLAYRDHVDEEHYFYSRGSFSERLFDLVSKGKPPKRFLHSHKMLRYDWKNMAVQYDRAFEYVTK